ncbi:MAG: nitroreductase family protein, partial [Methanobacteriota archaeon]
DVGIAAQTMMLAAAERGFGGCMIGSIERERLSRQLSLPPAYEIQLVLAFGHPAQTITLDPLPAGRDTRYWRDLDGIHHVPKRSLDDVLLALPQRTPLPEAGSSADNK